MANFNEQLPVWLAPGMQPREDIIENGYQEGQRPPAEWFNYTFYHTYHALKELQENAESTEEANRKIEEAKSDAEQYADGAAESAYEDSKTYTDGQVEDAQGTVDDLEESFDEHTADTDIHHTHNNKIYLDRLSEDTNGNLIYDGERIGTGSSVDALYREVAYLNLQTEANERIENGVTFADGYTNAPFGIEFDSDESTAIRTEDGIEFGVETEATEFERENVTVAEGEYSTEGNGGRKLVRMEDGRLIAAAYVQAVGNSHYTIYCSDNNGETWEKVGDTRNASRDIALATRGKFLYFAHSLRSGLNPRAIQLGVIDMDEMEFRDGWLSSDNAVTTTTPDGLSYGLIDIGNCSLAIDPENGALHAVWSCKHEDSQRTQSINDRLRYSKSTDGGYTWSEPIFILDSVSNHHQSSPTILVHNGDAIVLSNYRIANTRHLRCYASNTSLGRRTPGIASGWSDTDVYTDDNNDHQPSSCIAPDGTIHVAWYGEHEDYDRNVIYHTNSEDGGQNWRDIAYYHSIINTHFENCSITADSDGNIYVVMSRNNTNRTTNRIRTIRINNNGSVENTTNYPTFGEMGGHSLSPQALYDPYFNFTVMNNRPPFIFAVDRGDDPRVYFYGNWQEHEEIPLEEPTAIYHINRETNELIVWVQRDDDVEITAYANDQPMDKETEGNEDQFAIQFSESAEIELKFEMTQPDGDEVRRITKVLGGVARG